jgi:hypothetical protein
MSFSSHGPESNDCRTILSAVIDAYCQDLKEIYTTGTPEFLAKLEKADKELRQTLATAEAEYARFKRDSKPGPTALEREYHLLQDTTYRNHLDRLNKLFTLHSKALEDTRKHDEWERQGFIRVNVLSPPTPGARK